MSQTILSPFNDVDPQVLQSLSNLADELQSKAQKELLDEISELTLIALGIVISLNKANTIIEEVKTPLSAVVLNPVQDAMSTCKSNYTKTLKESLNVAQHAQETSARFVELYDTVLSKDETPIETKLKAIDDYDKKVAAESDNAKHLIQFYKDLRTQVDDWFSVWKKATELLGLEIPPDIRTVDGKIASATKIINQVDAQVTTWTSDYKLSFAPAGAPTALGGICPQTNTDSVCQAVKMDSLIDVLAKAKRERDGALADQIEQKNARRLLEAALKGYQAIMAIVEYVYVAFEKVLHIFDVITGIWTNIRVDLIEIHTTLNLPGHIPELLKGRLKYAASMYKALSVAFDRYKNIPVPVSE